MDEDAELGVVVPLRQRPRVQRCQIGRDGRQTNRPIMESPIIPSKIECGKKEDLARGPECYFPCGTNIDSPRRNAPTTMMSAPTCVVFSRPSARDHVEAPTRASPATIRTVPMIAGKSLMLMA